MKLHLANKYNNRVNIICKGFRFTNYMKELEVYFDDIPNSLVRGQLLETSLTESTYSKLTWTIKLDDIGSFTNQSI